MQCCVFCYFCFSFLFSSLFPIYLLRISKDVLASGESLTRVPAYFNSLLCCCFLAHCSHGHIAWQKKKWPKRYYYSSPATLILASCLHVLIHSCSFCTFNFKWFCCIEACLWAHRYVCRGWQKRSALRVCVRQRRPMNRNVYCRMLHDHACFSIQFKRWCYSFPAIIDKQIQTSWSVNSCACNEKRQNKK